MKKGDIVTIVGTVDRSDDGFAREENDNGIEPYQIDGLVLKVEPDSIRVVSAEKDRSLNLGEIVGYANGFHGRGGAGYNVGLKFKLGSDGIYRRKRKMFGIKPDLMILEKK